MLCHAGYLRKATRLVCDLYNVYPYQLREQQMLSKKLQKRLDEQKIQAEQQLQEAVGTVSYLVIGRSSCR